jgi:hypothetical protein
MHRYIKAVLPATLGVMIGAQQGHAFDNSQNLSSSDNFGAGPCAVFMQVNASAQTAYVYLAGGMTANDAGGSYFERGTITPSPQISAGFIASCLGVTEGQVVGLVQNGADGTFAADAYIGFAFNLTTAAGGLSAGWHEYMVGTGTLIPADTTRPTVAVLVADTALVAGETSLVTFTFSEPVTGFTNNDLTIANGTLSSVASSDGGTTFTATFTPTAATTDATNVITVDMTGVMDLAQNTGVGSTDSNNYAVDTGNPATEFVSKADTIRETLTGDATRTLQSIVATNQRMSRDARARFVLAQDPEAVGETSVPVDVDGSLEVNSLTVSSKGSFYGLAGIGNGTRRIVFGDFDVQHDGETGSSTATLNGRVAWEQMLSDTTMLGYFIGGELARSNIAGEFAGAQNRVGVTVGGYAVQELTDHVLLDGFFSLGAGRNNLEITDTVLALDSDYTTRSASVGAALSGVVQQDGFEVRPELSLNYGRTWIGNVAFIGRAYGLVDDTLSLDAGQVTLANLLLRPEVRVPVDGLPGADSLQVVTFAPRLMCEQIKAATTEENCGGGAEFGFSGRSVDGLSSVSAKVMADRIGGATKSSLQLSLEHRF